MSNDTQIKKALNHIASSNAQSEQEQIIQALQHMADHDSQGRPLPETVISFTAESSGNLIRKVTANINGAGSGDATSDDPGSTTAPPAAGSKDMATLLSMLNDASGGPKAAEKSGSAPAPTQIGIVPPSNDSDVETKYNYLMDMASMIQLYTCIYDLNKQKERGAKEPNGITDPLQAAQAFADQADAAFLAMTGPLAGFYDITSETAVDYSKNMRKTEIHLEFLGELFKGFSLGKSALDQLDGVLTNFVSTISDLNVTSSSENNSIDQTVIIHQVSRTNVSGDDDNPQWIFEPKTRLIYMKIDSQSWFWATNKASDAGFNFKMHNVVVDATLNVEKFLGSKDKLDKIFIYLTDKNLQQFGTDITGTPVKSEN